MVKQRTCDESVRAKTILRFREEGMSKIRSTSLSILLIRAVTHQFHRGQTVRLPSNGMRSLTNMLFRKLDTSIANWARRPHLLPPAAPRCLPLGSSSWKLQITQEWASLRYVTHDVMACIAPRSILLEEGRLRGNGYNKCPATIEQLAVCIFTLTRCVIKKMSHILRSTRGVICLLSRTTHRVKYCVWEPFHWLCLYNHPKILNRFHSRFSPKADHRFSRSIFFYAH